MRIALCFVVYKSLACFDKIKIVGNAVFSAIDVIHRFKQYVIACKGKEHWWYLRKTMSNSKNIYFTLPATDEQLTHLGVGTVLKITPAIVEHKYSFAEFGNGE